MATPLARSTQPPPLSSSSLTPEALTKSATTLRALHKPGQPLVLANAWDFPSALAIASLPSCHALATASYAIARSAGLADDDLDLDTNLTGVGAVARASLATSKPLTGTGDSPLATSESEGKANGIPLTADLQDGYGERLEEAVRRLLELGGVGCNLEDWDRGRGGFYSVAEAAERVRRVVETAREVGVGGFVVNARCDVLVHGGSFEETITRGKAYLEAGATSVFVWGGGSGRVGDASAASGANEDGPKNFGISKQEIEQLVTAFDGRLNVSLKLGVPGALTVAELAKIGVSRISIGPTLQFKAMERVAEVAGELLGQDA